MRVGLALILWLAAAPVVAQDFPAFYQVVGVAADDVLNIRERPLASAPIIGALAPGETGVEVLAISDGWALVAAGEGAGYSAARFLQRQDGPGWMALETPLLCHGTEPFWSLSIDPLSGRADYLTPEMSAPETLQIGATWPGQPWSRMVGLSLPNGFAALSPLACSDGMSDRPFGIGIDLFLNEPLGGQLSGCCLMVAP
jgi:uncharacterized membrane protein